MLFVFCPGQLCGGPVSRQCQQPGFEASVTSLTVAAQRIPKERLCIRNVKEAECATGDLHSRLQNL
jgi:hypothetical protein